MQCMLVALHRVTVLSGWLILPRRWMLFSLGAAAVAVDADAARRQRPVAWSGAGVSGDSGGAQQHGHEAHSCQPEMSKSIILC
jgi:hypothetical protein